MPQSSPSCRFILFCLSLALQMTSCGDPGTRRKPTTETTQTVVPNFAEARNGFVTKLTKQSGTSLKVEAPSPALFSVIQYPTAIGNMAAYLGKVPNDGKLHPAMIWISGGFGNDISDVWSEQEPDNDQSASVFREAGIVMMYPSQRGGNENPGADETCFGEIDDIIAAAKYLASQKGIDPKRIYLGGHSTGGTKVLLVAECSNLFRATFSFGPAAAVREYGSENLTFDESNEKEFQLREPIRWLRSLTTPVFIFEGEQGNAGSLADLKERAAEEKITLAKCFEVKGKDHFSVIQPVSRLIAARIIADDKGGKVDINFETELKALP